MSTLSSSSTFDEVFNSYLDNGSYEEDNSPSKAAAFITACRLLIVLIPKRSGNGRAVVEVDVEQIKKELEAARQWKANNPSSDGTLSRGGARSFSMEDFYS